MKKRFNSLIIKQNKKAHKENKKFSSSLFLGNSSKKAHKENGKFSSSLFLGNSSKKAHKENGKFSSSLFLGNSSKKAQVAIFIIIGILLVAAIALFIVFRKEIIPPGTFGRPEVNIRNSLENCMSDKIKEGVDLISSQGGYTEPEFYRTFKFEDEDFAHNIAYLCYTRNYYVPCINQQPLLIQHIKDELKNYIGDDVESCIENIARDLEDNGYTAVVEYNDFSVELAPGKVATSIDAKMTLTYADETSTEENFEIETPTQFYDISKVVQTIVAEEAKFCNFDYFGYMMLNPEWDIDYFRTSDSTIIYTVKHRETGEWFRFAVRSCVLPGVVV